MSGGAQRVLDALIGYDKECGLEFPIQAISDFFSEGSSTLMNEDYQELTAEEERQIIEAFLEHSY